jgi:hypothetical protein
LSIRSVMKVGVECWAPFDQKCDVVRVEMK